MLGQIRDDVSQEKGLNLDWSANKPSLRWVFRQAPGIPVQLSLKEHFTVRVQPMAVILHLPLTHKPEKLNGNNHLENSLLWIEVMARVVQLGLTLTNFTLSGVEDRFIALQHQTAE